MQIRATDHSAEEIEWIGTNGLDAGATGRAIRAALDRAVLSPFQQKAASDESAS